MNSAIAIPLKLTIFISSIFYPAAGTTVDYIPYNLVYELPNILISEQTERLGETWRHGEVWDKPLINRFFSLMHNKTEPLVVLDVGAQTGSFTLLSKFMPASQWYAFEPIQEAADLLKGNLELNEIQNVEVHPVAVSDRAGSVSLKLPIDAHWGLSTLGDTPLRFGVYSTRAVESIDLDTFALNKGIKKVDFIKIDTEGWELFVLRGAKELIRRDKPTILMEFNRTNMEQCQVDPGDVLHMLYELDYEWTLVSSEDLLCTPRQ